MPSSLGRTERRVRAALAGRVDPSAARPSFVYKDREMRRLRRLALDLPGGSDEPVWTVNDKDDAHRWAERLGVRRAGLLAQWGAAEDVDFAALPGAVVLKPRAGAASRGVHLLRREGSAWRDVRTGRATTAAAVVAELQRLAASGATSRALLAEELVEDPHRPGLPPVDWKVMTFFGRLGVVIAKSHGRDGHGRPTVRWRLFDEHWRDLGRAFSDHHLDRSIRPPAHAEELLDVARRVSASVPRPFLRVDLYDGPDGPVFGEVTPEPGWAFAVRRDVDRWLGGLWEEAEARLALRLRATGAVDPADAPLPQSPLGWGRPADGQAPRGLRAAS